MTSEQLEQSSQPLEARVATLEAQLADVKQTIAAVLQKKVPWWLEVAGSFKTDPTFDEAIRLGEEWRRSAD